MTDVKQMLWNDYQEKKSELDMLTPDNENYKTVSDEVEKLRRDLIEFEKAEMEKATKIAIMESEENLKTYQVDKDIEAKTYQVNVDKEIKISQIETDEKIRREQICVEKQSKNAQLAADEKNEWIRNGITIGTFVINTGLMLYGMKKTFKFDATDTVTSTLGRGILNNCIPKIFKK